VKHKKIILSLLFLLFAWIVTDICYPFKTDIRKIDTAEMARLDGAMWKSYYAKKPVRLFMQSAELMRNQFHMPFFRSYLVSYYLAKAAFTFKDGKNRKEYAKAQPYLLKYYSHINNISNKAFNADSAAAAELEWWIIRRERQQHPPQEWEQWLAKTASIMYHIPADKFKDYARLRVEAMLLRDEKGDNITGDNWQKIDLLLQHAWQSFGRTVEE
jgi:hypothetical protein